MKFLKWFLLVSIIGITFICCVGMGYIAFASIINGNIWGAIGFMFLFLLFTTFLTAIANGYVCEGWFD